MLFRSRTIVGEAPGDCLAQLSPSNSSVGSDQNVSSPENESHECSMERRVLKRRVIVSRKSKEHSFYYVGLRLTAISPIANTFDSSDHILNCFHTRPECVRLGSFLNEILIRLLWARILAPCHFFRQLHIFLLVFIFRLRP